MIINTAQYGDNHNITGGHNVGFDNLRACLNHTPRSVIALTRTASRNDALRCMRIWLRIIEEELFPKYFAIPVLAREFLKLDRERGRSTASWLVARGRSAAVPLRFSAQWNRQSPLVLYCVSNTREGACAAPFDNSCFSASTLSRLFRNSRSSGEISQHFLNISIDPRGFSRTLTPTGGPTMSCRDSTVRVFVHRGSDRRDDRHLPIIPDEQDDRVEEPTAPAPRPESEV
ncbi:MAG: hypothetical protein LAO51_14240 [Acidobacteriia bacterium]|nr:hypothetical protein [Terriglobia bacterium]